MKTVAIDLTPSASDQGYLDECLRLFKQKTADLNLTEAHYQAVAENVQLRMGCWNVMYWFRMDNYPVLNPLNAEYVE